jgi:hypothetical protein
VWEACVAEAAPTVMNFAVMPATKTSKPAPNKSAFIRSQPPTMTTAEVVRLAKDAGIKVNEHYVSKIRSAANAAGKKPSKAPTAKKASVTKTAPATKPSASKADTFSTSEFVLARPHLSPKEIVEDARDYGMKLTAKHVYNARGYDAARSVDRGKVAPKNLAVATKPAPSTTNATTMTKAAFIRSHLGSSVKEVMAQAKAAGIYLTENHVSAVRSQERAKRGQKRVATARPVVQKPVVPVTVTHASGGTSARVEDLLKAAAAELGLGRAIEILQGERARVRAVIGQG